MQSSGAFTYTPAAGFTGTDSFTYRALTGVGIGGAGPIAYSDPATVAILAAAPACRADFNGDGVRNVADIFVFLSAWFAGCS